MVWFFLCDRTSMLPAAEKVRAAQAGGGAPMGPSRCSSTTIHACVSPGPKPLALCLAP
jgi:hypothetical protein